MTIAKWSRHVPQHKDAFNFEPPATKARFVTRRCNSFAS
jgi:hypothetical protein